MKPLSLMEIWALSAAAGLFVGVGLGGSPVTLVAAAILVGAVVIAQAIRAA